ncbi:tyrosine-type recombinase/integrase [Oerskovia enterophila]
MATKRANGDGSVRQRKSGRWEGRLAFSDPETGRTKRVSFYGATAGEVREKLRGARNRVVEGVAAQDSSMTVAFWCERWSCTTLAASSRRTSTKELSEGLLRKHVATTTLGGVALRRLRPMHIDQWLLELRGRTRTRANADGTTTQVRSLAESSVIRVFQVLKVALDGAVREGLLATNPMQKVRVPVMPRREARHLNSAELQALLRAAHGTRNYELLKFIAATGMRKGEAMALHWKDIDVDSGKITVRGTLTRSAEGLKVTEPKTHMSWRTIALSAGVLRLLRAVRARQAEERDHACNLWEENDLVFTTERGRPVDPRNVLRAIHAAASEAGLQGVTVHTLRHTAATTLLDSGRVHLRGVSDVLGHAGTQVTSDIYAHTTHRTMVTAMDVLSDSVGL